MIPLCNHLKVVASSHHLLLMALSTKVVLIDSLSLSLSSFVKPCRAGILIYVEMIVPSAMELHMFVLK